MWNIAHNLGGFAAPLVAGGFAKAMGWKWGMWAPGIIGLAVGCIVLLTCRWGCAVWGAALQLCDLAVLCALHGCSLRETG